LGNSDGEVGGNDLALVNIGRRRRVVISEAEGLHNQFFSRQLLGAFRAQQGRAQIVGQVSWSARIRRERLLGPVGACFGQDSLRQSHQMGPWPLGVLLGQQREDFVSGFGFIHASIDHCQCSLS
jgi:hypothetical protein